MELQDKIKTNGERLHFVAGKLSERWTAFEIVLQRLPGRVEARVSRDGLTISVRRQGKAWGVFCEPDGMDEKPIGEARLQYKIQAVGMVPDLFDAMLSAQTDLMIRVEDACERFDRIDAELELGINRETT